MALLADGERSEVEALERRQVELRAHGYDMDISYSGWAVRFDGLEIGSGTFQGAVAGRPGILVLTDRIRALQEAVGCAAGHLEAMSSNRQCR